eukprot:1981007-Rhodomonas_salina.3
MQRGSGQVRRRRTQHYTLSSDADRKPVCDSTTVSLESRSGSTPGLTEADGVEEDPQPRLRNPVDPHPVSDSHSTQRMHGVIA